MQGGKAHAWQNSWGLSTRTIGVMVMVHGDDKVLHPLACCPSSWLCPIAMGLRHAVYEVQQSLEPLTVTSQEGANRAADLESTVPACCNRYRQCM